MKIYSENYGCCGSTRGRQFLTKDEKVELLNDYKDWLTKEAKGVEETIAKLKTKEAS